MKIKNPFIEQCDANVTVFSGDGYKVEICNEDYMGKIAECKLSAGTKKSFIVKGIVISNDSILVGGEIRINWKNGRITEVGCDLAKSQGTFLDCPGALISAGLINLHEHTGLSFNQPKVFPPSNHRYQHRDEWRFLSEKEKGFKDISYKNQPSIHALLSKRTMLRHMLSGTTAVAGDPHVDAFARNLELTGKFLATPASTPVNSKTRPFDDRYTSIYPVNISNPYVPHIGEGINLTAFQEVNRMLAYLSNKTTPNAFIHGIPLDQDQIIKLKKQDVSIIIALRSNLNLYGITTAISELVHRGVNLAISTDWSPSGSLTMFDEMRCLSRYNQRNLNNLLSWSDIHRMATTQSALAVGLQKHIGGLGINELADFIIIDTQGLLSLGDVLGQSGMRNIFAVFIGGKAVTFPSAWDSKLLKTLFSCVIDERMLCGQNRTICGLGDSTISFKDLVSNKLYEIDDEMTCTAQSVEDCTPFRNDEFDGNPTDSDFDGDGIPDHVDNCPGIFNPVLPVKNGTQMRFFSQKCKIEDKCFPPDVAVVHHSGSSHLSPPAWINVPAKIIETVFLPADIFVSFCVKYFDNMLNAAKTYALMLTQDCPSYFPSLTSGQRHESLFWSTPIQSFSKNTSIAPPPAFLLN